MLKVILSVLFSVFAFTSLVVILYWRDAKFEPSSFDILMYLAVMPLLFSLILLAPYLTIKWLKTRKEKQVAQQEAAQREQEQVVEEPVADEYECFEIGIYSAAINSALGENQQLIRAIQTLSGPELDTQLLDSKLNPSLSYRMKMLDELIEQDGETFEVNPVQQRVNLLIQQQLEQYVEAFRVIADHLKNSAMFYDNQLAYEYHIHPAWINPNASIKEDELPTVAKQVARLDKINVHILLTEGLLHHWDELKSTSMIEQYLDELGVLSKQINCEYHYLSLSNSYATWLKCLAGVDQQAAQVSLFIIADSEIDQTLMDEKSWLDEKYVAAEFAASCLVAAKNLQIQHLDHTQHILVITKQKRLMHSLESLKLLELEQYQQDQPFISVLDNPAVPKVAKKLQQYFAGSPIEPEHYLYGQSSLGNSQNLSGIFSFMLATQMQASSYTMVYSVEHPLTQVFMSPESLSQVIAQADNKI